MHSMSTVQVMSVTKNLRLTVLRPITTFSLKTRKSVTTGVQAVNGIRFAEEVAGETVHLTAKFM